MIKITKEQVSELRAATGAPIIDCRRALETAGGDVSRARELLQERGHALAASKAGRTTGQGTIGMYVHSEGRIAALVLLRCETDFVAKSPAFQGLAKELAMQVAAMNPRVIRPEDAPVGARIDEVALLAQPWIKDSSGKQRVADFLAARVLELGENIVIERFVRMAVS